MNPRLSPPPRPSFVPPRPQRELRDRTRTRAQIVAQWAQVALCQAAWAASHSHDSYLSAQYRRVARRRGKKQALVTVAHSLPWIVYGVLKDKTEYRDLGAGWFDSLAPQWVQRHLVRRLESLGYRVTLEPQAAA